MYMVYFMCRSSRNICRFPRNNCRWKSLGGDLTYSERPIKILDTAERVTCSKVIKMCKVQWSHHTEDEANWEQEELLRADYPGLFLSASWISRATSF
jgi:hypothetical protein